MQKSENTYKTLKEYLYSQLPSLLTRKSQGSFVRRKAMKCTEYEKHKQRLLSVGYNNNNDVIGNSNLSIQKGWKDELHTVNQQVTSQETRQTDDVIAYTSNRFEMCTNEVTRTLQITLECNVVLRSDITQDVCKTTAVFSWADGFQYANAEREIFFLVKDDIKMVVLHFFCLDTFCIWCFSSKNPAKSDRIMDSKSEPPRNGMQLEIRNPAKWDATGKPKPPRNGMQLENRKPREIEIVLYPLSTETKTCAFLWVDVIQGRKTDHHVSFVVHYS